MTQREKHLEQIARTKNEIALAKPGPHKRDLIRALTRLERDLRQYDLYRVGAERHGRGGDDR